MASISKWAIFFAVLITQIVVLVIYVIKSDVNTRSFLKRNQAAVRFSTSTAQTISGFNSGYNRVRDKSGDYPLDLTVASTSYRSAILKRNDKSSSEGNTYWKGDSDNSTVGSNKNGKRVSYDKRTSGDQPGTFQPITNSEAWVYSAHYDHVAAQNGQPSVRIFGVVQKKHLVKAYCHFSFIKSPSFTSYGTITDFPEGQNRWYLPAYLECPLPSNERPTHVSVSFETTDKPTNRLKIIYPGPRIRNFTVCYSVLHSGYNKTTQLIESMELNRILGAEHFMVYNYSISPEVSQILSRYQEDGLVTVLQWPIPTRGSWYFAQTTALNDCFYRNRNTSRFVVVVDTDELIVPRYHYTWMELIRNVSQQVIKASNRNNKGDNRASCFIFKSSFFYLDNDVTSNWRLKSLKFPLTANQEAEIAKNKIILLSKFIRSSKIYQYNKRSKYIACPDQVQSAGVHYVNKLISNGRCLNVTEKLVLVHHYRTPSNDVSETIRDTSVLKFKQQLLGRILDNLHKVT